MFLFFCHNKNYCFRQNFRTILHWHWHAFSWPLAPASNGGKIITFLPSTCEWSRHRRLHVVGRLLVIITSIWLSCEAAFKAASHDSQMLVITTSKRPTTWRRRYLDHSHVLGKKVIIFPSFDAGANGQLKACQCQCKIFLKFFLKQ